MASLARGAACVAVCGLAMSASVLAQLGAPPRVVYSTVAASPTSDVPGLPGLKFSSFDRPVRSPNGARWMLLARINSGSTSNDAVYMVGSGTSGVVVVREGVTEIEPGRVPENMSDRRVAVADDATHAFQNDLTGDTSNDLVAVRATPTGFVVVARQEQSVAGVIPGASINTISDVNMSNAGAVAFRTSLSGLTTATDGALLLNNAGGLVAQEGNAATAPTGQIASDTWASFDFGNFWVDASGANWLARGSLNGAAAQNQIVAVNNAVVVQESAVLPGLGSPVFGIISANMNSDGTWFARGENTDNAGWVVRGGLTGAPLVIASTATNPQVPGGVTGENYDASLWNIGTTSPTANTFFEHTGNNRGDFVVGGFTNNTDSARNAVWVFNNLRVALRRGDAVDLDGNGAADDNINLERAPSTTDAGLNNKVTGGFLTDDGWFYFTADLTSGLGGPIAGEALLRVRLTCPADVNRSGSLTVQDIFDYLGLYFSGDPRADFNGAGGVTVQDIFDLLSAYFAGC